MDKFDIDNVPVNREYKTVIVDPSISNDRDYSLESINRDGNWVFRSATPFDSYGQGSVMYLFSRDNLELDS